VRQPVLDSSLSHSARTLVGATRPRPAHAFAGATVLLVLAAAAHSQGLQVEASNTGAEAERPQGICIAETLVELGQAITRLSRLDPAADITCTVAGATRYAADPPLEQPQSLLFDKQTSGQGVFGAPDTPLIIAMEFVSRQRIQCIQLLYAGQWAAPGLPAVRVEVTEDGTEARLVGTMPAMSAEPAARPIIQQVNFPDGNGNRDGQWRRVRLSIPGLPPELGLVEIRVIGYDEGLRGIGTGLNQIARDPAAISVGNISNIAVAVRSRRLSASKSIEQHEAVHRLSRVISLLSGVYFELLIDTPAQGEQPAEGRLRIDNASNKPLDASIIKLRLPPGWRAAPAKHDLSPVAAGQCIFLPTSIYPANTEELPTVCLYGGYDGEPLFLMADTVGVFAR
jgi:hypothetical protein